MLTRTKRKSVGVFRKGDLRTRNRPPFVAGMIIGTLSMLIGCGIAIAAWTSVPQITRAPGEITPTDDFRQIEAPELGTIVTVSVREGDIVTSGQVLATLSSTDLSRQIFSYEAELEAFRNQLSNHNFILQSLDQHLTEVGPPADKSRDMSYALSSLNVLKTKQQSDLDAIERLGDEVQSQKSALMRLKTRRADKVKQVEDAQGLFERGLSTKTKLNDSKDALSAIDDQIQTLALSISDRNKDIATLKAKRVQDRLALREKHVEEKFKIEQQLAVKETDLRNLHQRAAALRIVAPTDGHIHSIGFPNKGEIFERGETLFELLPTGEALVATLRLPTRDIGHISTGMAVKMRLETFDARSNLPLDGQIRSISPNRVFDRDLGEDYFRATVELTEENASFSALENQLSAGMVLTADIVTRERSMLTYILKPIERSLTLAFGER